MESRLWKNKLVINIVFIALIIIASMIAIPAGANQPIPTIQPINSIQQPIQSVRSFDYFPLRIDNLQKQQMRQWEWDKNTKLSNIFMSQLAEGYENAWMINAEINIGYDVTIRQLRRNYESMGRTFSDVANLYRVQTGLGSTAIGTQNTARGLRIFDNTIDTLGILMDGFTVGADTIWRTGKSMQIMNPPTYLSTKASWGWAGMGSLPGGGKYWENLITDDTNIKRIHANKYVTPFGYEFERIETRTSASRYERFMMNNFPLGSYFDPEKTTINRNYKSVISYEIVNGNIQPMPTIPKIQSIQPMPTISKIQPIKPIRNW